MSDQRGWEISWDQANLTSRHVLTRDSGLNVLAPEADGVSNDFLD